MQRAYTYPVALHAKAIALYSLDGISSNSYEALIDAIEADPDAPFYALGIWKNQRSLTRARSIPC